MPKSKLVAVWGRKSLLGSSIESFLASQLNCEVISISKQEDLDAWIQAVENNQSEIVIIQQADCNDHNEIPLQLLQGHPTIKIIKISLENNLMEIYTKQQIPVMKATDLITAIENLS